MIRAVVEILERRGGARILRGDLRHDRLAQALGDRTGLHIGGDPLDGDRADAAFFPVGIAVQSRELDIGRHAQHHAFKQRRPVDALLHPLGEFLRQIDLLGQLDLPFLSLLHLRFELVELGLLAAEHAADIARALHLHTVVAGHDERDDDEREQRKLERIELFLALCAEDLVVKIDA
jgi:hypothetical protein